jgi:hypothetical protein
MSGAESGLNRVTVEGADGLTWIVIGPVVYHPVEVFKFDASCGELPV